MLKRHDSFRDARLGWRSGGARQYIDFHKPYLHVRTSEGGYNGLSFFDSTFFQGAREIADGQIDPVV